MMNDFQETYNKEEQPIQMQMKEEIVNNQTKKTTIEFSTLVEVINTLANSVKDMTSKVEKFKSSMEDRVTKIEAELALMKNKFNIFESNSNSIHKIKSNEFSTVHDNDHIFSFADDRENILNINNSSSARNTSPAKKKILDVDNIHYNKQQVKVSPDKNYNTLQAKTPNKILSEIEETDSLIERVEKRFRETQKLLSEFK